MKRHLIALDLDGTLLYNWSTLDEKTKDYLIKFKDQGHQIIIATGRPFRSSIKFYRALKLDAPMINYNGGLVSWPGNADFDEINIKLDRVAVVDIFKANEPYIENAFCEIKDDIYLMKESEDIVDLLHFFNNARLFVGDFKKTLPGDVNGFIIVAKKGKGHLIEAYVKANYPNKVMSRNWGDDYQFIIELYTPHNNKGRALEYVANYYDIPKERVIAFGDGNNDLEMIDYAGIGVAVQNACEELKAIADVVSPHTHQEHTIEKFLDQYFAEKKVESD